MKTGRKLGDFAYTNDQLLQALQTWVRNYGRPPRLIDWCGGVPGYPSATTIKVRYGSWNAFLLSAGLPVYPGRGGQRKRKLMQEHIDYMAHMRDRA